MSTQMASMSVSSHGLIQLNAGRLSALSSALKAKQVWKLLIVAESVQREAMTFS
jgi:hypothetical protein